MNVTFQIILLTWLCWFTKENTNHFFIQLGIVAATFIVWFLLTGTWTLGADEGFNNMHNRIFG